MSALLAALMERPAFHPKFPSHPKLKPFKCKSQAMPPRASQLNLHNYSRDMLRRLRSSRSGACQLLSDHHADASYHWQERYDRDGGAESDADTAVRGLSD